MCLLSRTMYNTNQMESIGILYNMCKRLQQTLIIQYKNISSVSFQGRSFKCLNPTNVNLYQIECIDLAMWGGVYESYCKARDAEKVYKHRDLILCYRKLNVAQIVSPCYTALTHYITAVNSTLLFVLTKFAGILYRSFKNPGKRLQSLSTKIVCGWYFAPYITSQQSAACYQLCLSDSQGSAISVPRPSFKPIHFLDQTEIFGSQKVWTVSPIVTSNLDYGGW